MKPNIGKKDRIMRVMLGLVIIALGIRAKSLWGLVGLAPLVSAGIGWCGLYQIFGISTCKLKK